MASNISISSDFERLEEIEGQAFGFFPVEPAVVVAWMHAVSGCGYSGHSAVALGDIGATGRQFRRLSVPSRYSPLQCEQRCHIRTGTVCLHT